MMQINGAAAQELQPLTSKAFRQVLAGLQSRRLLTREAIRFLRRMRRMRMFYFRFHAVRCTEAPRTPYISGGAIPWRRVGNIWAWAQPGALINGQLLPSSQPNAVWLEFCLVK